MKKPNIDLSKEGLQRFALYHIEKVILTIAFLGFCAFLWLGISTQKFADTNPQQLSQKADSADRYIKDPESWNKVVDLRVARDKAHEIIKNTRDLSLDGYLYTKGQTLLKSRGLRLDPDLSIAKPSLVESEAIRAPILIEKGNRRSRLDDLVAAGRRRGSDENDKEDETKFGDKVSKLQQLEVFGLQPQNTNINSGRHMSFVTNIVAVRALVEFEKLWNEYDAKLKDSVGYFPGRDRPSFQLLQIQRKIGQGDWEDITVSLKRLPFATNRVPEVISPENRDIALCGMIPPIAMIDYRDFALHSKLQRRSFKKSAKPNIDEPEKKDPENTDEREEKGKNPNDPFSTDEDEADDDAEQGQDENEVSDEMGPAKAGSDWRIYDIELDVDGPAAPYKMVRFFDVNVPNNSEVKYRFRIWVDDPNNEPGEEGTGNRGGNNGGRNDDGRDEDDGSGLDGGDVGSGGGGRGGVGGVGGVGGAGGGRGGFGGGRGGQGDRGGSGGNRPLKEVPITDSMKDITVRNRIDREREQHENDSELRDFFADVKSFFPELDLRYSRASDWTEVTVKVPDLEGSFAVAGNVAARNVKDRDGRPVLTGDSQAEIVLSDWSKRFGTLVSTYKRVMRGDLLGAKLDAPAHVLHLADNEIKKLPEYEFESNRIIVDLMGGEYLTLPRVTREHKFDSPIRRYSVPGEILVMDLSGNFSIQSTSEDRAKYLTWRFQEDETSEYNQRRVNRRPRGDDDDDREGGDGGLGLGGGGRGR